MKSEKRSAEEVPAKRSGKEAQAQRSEKEIQAQRSEKEIQAQRYALNLVRSRGGTAPNKDLLAYQDNPAAYARDVLKFEFWSKQSEIARSVVENPITVVNAGHGVGKCVAYNERLTLSGGARVRAKNLIGRNFSLPTLDAEGNLTEVNAIAQDNGTAQCYEILTERGARIVRTGNHPLWAGRKEGEEIKSLGWVPVEELTRGMYIAAVAELPIFGDDIVNFYELSLLAYILACHDEHKSGRFNLKFSLPGAISGLEEIAEKMGFKVTLAGEATLDAVDSKGNPPEELTDLWQKAWLPRTESERWTLPSWLYRVQETDLRRFTGSLLALSATKPNALYRLINSEVPDATGKLIFEFRSKWLALDVAYLLRRWGVHPVVRSRHHLGRETGEVVIGPDQLPSFIAFIRDEALPGVPASSAYPGTVWEKINGVRPGRALQTVAISVPEYNTYVDQFYEHNTSATGAIVNWFLDACSPPLVISTAPTWNQVRSLLWKEIRRLRRGAGLPGRINETEIVISDDHFAIGISTDDETRFQGHHAENMLIVIDEGPGVREEIYNAIEGIRVGKNNRVLSLGNPISAFDGHSKMAAKAGANMINVSCLEHPNVKRKTDVIPGAVTYTWADEHIREWCERTDTPPSEDGYIFEWEGEFWNPSPIAMSKILGVVPPETEDQVIPYPVLRDAHARHEEMGLSRSATVQVGVDVARFGGDETVLYFNHGGRVSGPLVWKHLPTDESARRIWEVLRDKRVAPVSKFKVLIDEGGVGGGVVDVLQTIVRREHVRWIEVIPVQFGGSPNSGTQYANRRAELYYTMRSSLKKVGLPMDDRLDMELLAHRYELDSRGRIKIETKERIKSRLGRSPDRADALALAVYDGELAPGDKMWIPGPDIIAKVIKTVYSERPSPESKPTETPGEESKPAETPGEENKPTETPGED